jgi:hypothetical protein
MAGGMGLFDGYDEEYQALAAEISKNISNVAQYETDTGKRAAPESPRCRLSLSLPGPRRKEHGNTQAYENPHRAKHAAGGWLMVSELMAL